MKKTIRMQIMRGYFLVIMIPIAIILVSIFSLLQINNEVTVLSQNRMHQNATKDTIAAHYSWLLSLESTIQQDKSFTGSLDPTACGLGKWMAAV